MAGKGRRRSSTSITRLLEDVVDDARDLVDDVVDRAKDVERTGRRAVRRTVGEDRSDGDGGSAKELDELRSALDDLTAKVARLATLQADAATRDRE